MTAQNAAQLSQDNMAILSLSGVSAHEGTASQLNTQVKLQSTATINKMSKDFDNYVTNLRNADDADAANTAFSIAGDIFGTVGRLSYDSVRVNTPNNYDIGGLDTRSDPTFRVNDQFLTPLGNQRFGSLTGPTAPTFQPAGPSLAFNKGL